MMSPSVMWLEGLLAATGSRRIGHKWQCPAHGLTGEHQVSLGVGPRQDGHGAWLYCHAGCDLRDILRALHVPHSVLLRPLPVNPERHARATWKGKFPPPKSIGGSPQEQGFRFEAEHEYGDCAWKMRYRHPSGAKVIQWESLNPHGERVLGLLGRKERDLPLYRDRDIRIAQATGEVMVLVESESSVDALNRAGVYATTWAGGAGSVPIPVVQSYLADVNVLFVPDRDDAGRRSFHQVRVALPAVRWKVGLEGEDARDVLVREGAGWFT